MGILGRYVLALALLGSAMTLDAGETDDRKAIESSAQRWVDAFNVQNAAALAALTTQDVVVLGAGASPINGVQAACDLWRQSAVIRYGSITSVTKEIVIAGDVAWRTAAVWYQHPDSEKNHGQSLEIWKRTNGGWKLHRQMSSNILAQPIRRAPNELILDAPKN